MVGQQQIGTAITAHYQDLYKLGLQGLWRWTAGDLPRLTDDSIFLLSEAFTEEVTQTFRDLNREGSPGPDGFPTFFYKEFWLMVKVDVMAVIHEFASRNRGFERLDRFLLFMLPKHIH